MQSKPKSPQPNNPPLTDLKVFIPCAILCIIMGLVLGYLCAWMFYEVSHPKIATIPGAYTTATQIPPEIGIIFIIIMAATGLMIALTMHYVPRWVREYYESGKMPDWLVELYKKSIRLKEAFLEFISK